MANDERNTHDHGAGSIGHQPTEPESGMISAALARMWTGRVAGPIAAAATYWALPHAGLSAQARATAAVAALMAIWWMTEAVPLPATSLLPVVLFPVLGVADVEAATRPYANEIIFLFAGGFLLAAAVERWGLHRRIALRTVLVVGTQPRRLIAGFMTATGFLSMWVSNTATAVMMLPIGASVLALVASQLDIRSADDAQRRQWQRFGTALMLSIAYSASIGSVGTIIGTPPNGILVGYLAQQGTYVDFGQWMLLGVPLGASFMLLAWLLLTRVIFRLPAEGLPGGASLIRAELAHQGPINRGEKITLVVFAAAALAWVNRPLLALIPGLDGLTDATIAIAAAVALFLAPVRLRGGVMVLDWEHARRIPWEILVLFGGGLSLAAAISSTGLAHYIGQQLSGLGRWPTVAMVLAVAVVVVLLTEVTSNTATVAVFVPVLGGLAVGLEVDQLLLVIPAALVATFAFMLPVATPPNAIIFSSGRVTIGQMARAGLILNVVGALLTTVAMFTLATWVFGISL